MIRKSWTARGLAAALAGCSFAAATAQPPPTAPAAPPAAAAPADPAKPAATVNGEVITMGELEAVLRAAGPTPVALAENVKKQVQMEALGMLMDQVLLAQFLKVNAPPPPPAEVDRKLHELAAALQKQGKTVQDFCREEGQTPEQVKAGVGYALQWEAFARAKIGEPDLQRYYTEYKDFFDGVTVRCSHIVLRVPPTAKEEERAAAAQKLRGLRAEIAAGKLDFAEAAKKNSQCPSGASGGDIGPVARKYIVDEPFARAAFALKVGELSDVVQTDYGLHLIKAVDRKPGTPSDFAKIKDDVRQFYGEDLRQAVLAQQRQAAKIQVHLP